VYLDFLVYLANLTFYSIWQLGWINATRTIFTNVECSLKGLNFISNRQRRKEGTFCASELAGIEPTPARSGRQGMPTLTSRLRGAFQVLYLLPITSILGPGDQCLFLFATKEPSNSPAQGDKRLSWRIMRLEDELW
jgi:hypothetical protein